MGSETVEAVRLMLNRLDLLSQSLPPVFGIMDTPGYDPVSMTGLAAGGSDYD